MVRASLPVTLVAVRTMVTGVPTGVVAVGMPLMVPSVEFTVKPAGRPVAVNVAGVLLIVIGPNKKLRPCTAVAATGGVLRITGAMGLTVSVRVTLGAAL